MMFLTILLILFIIGSVVFWTVWNGIGPTPTAPSVSSLIMKNLPEKIEGTIIEAGSGFGQIAFSLAKRYPQNRVIAYENSPFPYLISKLLFRAPNLEIRFENFWKASFSEAGLIYCYLYPGAMKRMAKKEIAKGTWIVSNTFSIHGWQPEKTVEASDLYHSKIFLYCKK